MKNFIFLLPVLAVISFFSTGCAHYRYGGYGNIHIEKHIDGPEIPPRAIIDGLDIQHVEREGGGRVILKYRWHLNNGNGATDTHHHFNHSKVSVENNHVISFIRPVPGFLTRGLHDNNGIDFYAERGTPVRAAASGTIVVADYNSPGFDYNHGWGNKIIICHGKNSDGIVVSTMYGHLFKLNKIWKGKHVKQGDVIGWSGNTGLVRSSCGGGGYHLHFAVLSHGYAVKNPFVDEWNRLHPLYARY